MTEPTTTCLPPHGQSAPPAAWDRILHDGYCAPIGVLSPAEVGTAREALGAIRARLGGVDKLSKLHLHFRAAYDLARHPAILDAAQDILGRDLLVHATTLFWKSSEKAGYVPWHQDGYYLRLSPPWMITAWVALTDSTEESGCVRVIPGTHRDELPHVDSFPAGNPSSLLTTDLRLADPVDETRAVSLRLRAGEMSLHHVNLVHSSRPNRSTAPRVGFAIRLISAQVSQRRPHHPVVLARGDGGSRHYTVIDQPPPGDIDAGIRARQQFYVERDVEALHRPKDG